MCGMVIYKQMKFIILLIALSLTASINEDTNVDVVATITPESGILYYIISYYLRYLNHKISSISMASLKDGGEGAIYIYLKNNKKFTG